MLGRTPLQLALSFLGTLVGGFVGDVVSSVCKKHGEEGVKKLGELIAERRRRGQLAHNHDVEGALVKSLVETFHIFGAACREECEGAPERLRLVKAVVRLLTQPERLKAALERKLPVREGSDAMAGKAAKLAAPSLSTKFVQPDLVAAVHWAIEATQEPSAAGDREWLRARAAGPWRARREGGDTTESVRLAEVFAFCFREKIKRRAEVARLLTIDRLVVVDEKIDRLAAAFEAAKADLTAKLGAELPEAFAHAIGAEMVKRLNLIEDVLGEILTELRALGVKMDEHDLKEQAAHARTQQMIAEGQALRLGPVEPADYPVCFVGREAELAAVVNVVTAERPGTVVLIGEPGAGKSTVAQEAWRHRAVAKHFNSRRWFIRCDEVRNRSEFVVALAGQLHVTGGDGDPWHRIARALDDALGLLVLDNFEDFLDAAPDEAAEVLEELRCLHPLGLVLTVRGRVWARHALPVTEVVPVVGLPTSVLRKLFLAVRGESLPGNEDPWASDPGLDALLAEAEGSPDVVTHWARLSLAVRPVPGQPSRKAPVFPTPADLRTAWQAEAEILAKADAHYRPSGKWARQRGLDASYALSLRSWHHTAQSRRLVGLLGVLPAGATEDDLKTLFDDVGEACAVLVDKLGLAYFERERLRTRAPLRRFFARHAPPDEETQLAIESHWLGLAAEGEKAGRDGGAVAAVKITAEWPNIAALMGKLLAAGDVRALPVALGLGEFTRFQGLGDGRWLERLATLTMGADRANCIQRLGDIALERSDHAGAKARYEEALPVYREVGDRLGEANCIQRLGDIALARSDHAGAKARYEEALPVYREVGDRLGEANCIKSLGDIALARSDHAGAKARYEEALPIFQAFGDPYSEGGNWWRFALVNEGAERVAALREARGCFRSIDREDLVQRLNEAFPDVE